MWILVVEHPGRMARGEAGFRGNSDKSDGWMCQVVPAASDGMLGTKAMGHTPDLSSSESG